MRTPTIGSIQYQPGQAPATLPNDLQRFLNEELNRIAVMINLLSMGHLDMTYAPPAKPRTGDIRLADGVEWDPGSGRGMYWFDADVQQWNQLG